jgi:hypothetical protein
MPGLQFASVNGKRTSPNTFSLLSTASNLLQYEVFY